MDLEKSTRVELTHEQVESLYQKTRGQRYAINENSLELLLKIIELYFESKGYDFWDNPPPDLEEYGYGENDGIWFVYKNK